MRNNNNNNNSCCCCCYHYCYYSDSDDKHSSLFFISFSYLDLLYRTREFFSQIMRLTPTTPDNVLIFTTPWLIQRSFKLMCIIWEWSCLMVSPPYIKSEIGNTKRFELLLKKYLLQNTFYSLEEFYNHE